jgi:NADH-quinone oxidoreductase subunit M
MFQRVMLGPIDKKENKSLKDISMREFFSFVPILIFIVWIGVYPNTFLSKSETSVKKIVKTFNEFSAKNWSGSNGNSPVTGQK